VGRQRRNGHRRLHDGRGRGILRCHTSNGAPPAERDAATDSASPPPPRPEFLACENPEDCQLSVRTCCDSCGEESLEHSVAVRADAMTRWYEELCDGVPACTPPCMVSRGSSVIAACVQGQCTAIDIAPFSRCDSNDDCVLRETSCCSTCGLVSASRIVGVSAEGDASLHDALCGGDVACDDCESQPSGENHPRCADGQCIVVRD